MSDWHFGIDYDMWLYPPAGWRSPDYDYELPEPIEAANIEGTLLVNADDAIEQVRRLQTENDRLREQLEDMGFELGTENAKLRELCEDMLDCIEIREAFGRPPTSEMYEEFAQRADELGIEVDDEHH